MKKYNGVVAFAFGAPANTPPNRAIARRAKEIASRHGELPIAAQHEVAPKYAYHLDEGKQCVSTLWLARRLRGIAPVSWQKLLVVAAPPHLERVVRDLRYVGFDAEPDRELEYLYHEEFWFSRNSTQRWTRSPQLWRMRETIIHLMPWWLYEWISG